MFFCRLSSNIRNQRDWKIIPVKGDSIPDVIRSSCWGSQSIVDEDFFVFVCFNGKDDQMKLEHK